jgi:ribonuclease D
MIYLATICHDIKSNTLEATWLEETETEFKRVKCRTYSADQKEEFFADCGVDSQKYADLAEW